MENKITIVSQIFSEANSELLQSINVPADLRKLDERSLPDVCAELREFIIREVSSNPGHFGASLGVVELTVALHYVYNTPYDKLIWDVGHQAYGHKILTGRRKSFHTNRIFGGLSGFPNMSESEFDAFGVGHSSTSISAGLGIAMGAKLNGDSDQKVVSIIGDGSMTGGMAFEGLNNAATSNADILVILNDNNMAIDPNVGGVSRYLVQMQTSPTYNKIKSDIWKILGNFNKLGPAARKLVQQHQHALKSVLLHSSNLFESMGFRYFGPVDGHDVESLTRLLNDLRNIPGPKLLHVKTVKGKGFAPAEKNATQWHAAPGKFNIKTGEVYTELPTSPQPPKFQDVFGRTIVELAEKNEKIVGITPAMPTGCSLNLMMEKMPERTFDVGIAEQHAVTFSGGLATKGFIPFCNIYSSFMQRSYDQIIHDVALQKLNVVFCMDRAGLVGADGATHHGVFDIAFMRNIPNLTVAAPMDGIELRNLMYSAQKNPSGPFSIRYPRGTSHIVDWQKPFEPIETGTGRCLSKGEKIAVLSIGNPGNFVQDACSRLQQEGVSIGHYDMRFVKPLDHRLLQEVCEEYSLVITVEDGVIQGGFGSAVLEFMAECERPVRVIRKGIPDVFIEHGTQQELYRACGFDADGIYEEVKKEWLKM